MTVVEYSVLRGLDKVLHLSSPYLTMIRVSIKISGTIYKRIHGSCCNGRRSLMREYRGIVLARVCLRFVGASSLPSARRLSISDQ